MFVKSLNSMFFVPCYALAPVSSEFYLMQRYEFIFK